MKTLLHRGLLLISVSLTMAKDVDLPICPTNLQYFPQNLPMHCRMPGNSESNQNQGSYPGMQQFATMPPMSAPYYQSPPPDKQPNPIPIQIPPFPGMPGVMPMSGGMGGPMGLPMPGAMPMPMPMVGGPPHKLPVIVMPFYSPDNSFKRPPPGQTYRVPKTKPPRKKKKKSYDSDGDTSSSDTSSGDTSDASNGSGEHAWWKGHRKSSKRKATRRFNRRHKSKKRKERKENKNKKKDFLTPILQYVTKDGYVIFEKKISKNEAKDWLKPKNDIKVEEEVKKENEENNALEVVQKSAEETPKPEVEEEVIKTEEKSAEEVTETPSTTNQPSQKIHVRKHRPRKVNNLINQLGPEP